MATQVELRGIIRELLPSIIHVSGLGGFTQAIAAREAKRFGCQLVVSPRGMMSGWALSRSRHKKWMYRKGLGGCLFSAQVGYHALTSREAEEIRAVQPLAHVQVIPNPSAPLAVAAPHPGFYFLFMGRIHPKKNLEALLSAWVKCEPELACHGARLVVAGSGSPNYERKLRDLVGASSWLRASVDFVGHVVGASKASMLRGAACHVLPSFSEGLPMGLVEAGSVGGSIICSDESNFPLVGPQYGVFVTGTRSSDIADAIKLRLGIDPVAISSRGAYLAAAVADMFAPAAVGRSMIRFYNRLLNGGS